MNPSDYILPPDIVKARFPADLVGTSDYQAIVDACIDRLELPESAIVAPRLIRSWVRIQIRNDENGDFRDDYVTLTVSGPAKYVQVGTVTELAAGVVTRDDVYRLTGYRA